MIWSPSDNPCAVNVITFELAFTLPVGIVILGTSTVTVGVD